MNAAPLLPENSDGSSYLYISRYDPTPNLILRVAHASDLRTGFPSSVPYKSPFGELRSVTHIQPELQADLRPMQGRYYDA
jgi:hypothetical protein